MSGIASLTAGCALAAASLLLVAPARAQEIETGEATVEKSSSSGSDGLLVFGEALRAGLKLHMGFGGDFESDWHTSLGTAHDDDDMEVTAGFALLGEVSVLRYLNVGLCLGFYFFASDDMDDENIDRSGWIDISPVFKGRYPLLDGQLELYVKFLVGVAIAVPSDDLEDETGIKTGAGWNVGLHFGASYKVWQGISVFAELGWLGHGGESEFRNSGLNGDVEYNVHQFALNVGAFYDLRR